MTFQRFYTVARVAGILAVGLGATALVGGMSCGPRLTSAQPAGSTMEASSAIGFILAGTSLLVQIQLGGSRRRAWFGRTCALGGLAIGVATLAEHVLGFDLGIDQAPNTALGFALAGGSLGLLDGRVHGARSVSQAMAITVLLVGFVTCSGYVLGIEGMYDVAGYPSMAIQTAIALTALALGILLSRPQRGFIAVLAQDNDAGTTIRRLLPLIVVTPLAVAWVRLKGQHAGFYGPELGLVLMVTTSSIIMGLCAVWNSRVQGAREEERSRALRGDRFLFDLSELLRLSADSSDVLFRVSQRLGEHLGVSRCAFVEVDLARDRATVYRDYHVGVPSLAGVLQPSQYSPASCAAASAGHTIVSNDASSDDPADGGAEVYVRRGMRARITAPLLRDGRWVAALVVSACQPRAWLATEVALVQSVAERTWRWLEHLESVDALRRREQDLSVTLNTIVEGVIASDGARYATIDAACDLDAGKPQLAVARQLPKVLGELRAFNAELEEQVRERNARLVRLLEERAVLVQEVHHRVKNNLQVISSLLNMQIRRLESGARRSGLEQSRGRVEAIALIHEKLYESNDYARVPFSDYATDLASQIFRQAGASRAHIRLDIEVETIELPIDKAIPCGLIVNELIANALDHAFPDDRPGAVRVELQKSGADDIRLSVSDDGISGPCDLEPGATPPLGMHLVSMLVEQLDGHLEVVQNNGTRFVVTFR